jgi:hypothetical protein
MSTADEIYRELSVGEQLAHLEYLITEDKLRLFQEAVEYPEASFPSIAVKEYIEVLIRKYGPISVIGAKHKDRYFSPPRPNKRIQVTGWVREKYQRRDRNWLVVETFAVDEDGREIVRSEHTFLIGGLEKQEE